MPVMNLSALLKPEYIFQPKRLWNRLFHLSPPSDLEFLTETLPWGLKIQIRPQEEHGQILIRLGVIDLVVTEVLWRLTNPGEVGVDVGANIGYMTAVLASRIAQVPGGSVYAFEAHPEVFKELAFNVQCWRAMLRNVQLYPHNLAISQEAGSLQLSIPQAFNSNRGLAFVASADRAETLPPESGSDTIIDVPSQRLDDLFEGIERIGVLKIDVEGHELSVLKGAAHLLEHHKVRDCIFEEHRAYPTPVTDYFEGFGYRVFRLHRTFFKPVLLKPDSQQVRLSWLPTSFLATCDPERAIARLNRPGWQVLRS